VGTLRASTSGGNDVASGEGGLGTGAATSEPLLFRGGSEDDQLTGGEDVDFLAGDDGNDTIRGGNGDDRGLDGGPGNDTIDGQGGAGDVARYFDAASGVTVDLGQTSAQNTGGDGFDTLANLEHIEGSFHADVLSGNDGMNTIRGWLGADTLDGRGGNDTLDGGDATIGEPSPDTAIYASAASGVTVDLDAAEATGGGGTDSLVDIQNVTGSDFEDVLTGNAEENLLVGGEGPDTLTGGAGGDDVRGEGGEDELMLRDDTRDVANCGAEADNVTADAFGVDAIDANCETIDYLGGIPTPSPGGGGTGTPAPSTDGGVDTGGDAGTGLPSNTFTIARIARSRRTGGATLTLNLPGAGVVRVVATAKVPARLLRSRAARRIIVFRKNVSVTRPGVTKLALKPSRAAKRVMRRMGKLRVRLVVTYAPTGGAPSTQRRTLTLKLRRRR
jgi:Ca2+-binding RTX toxin-like protein